MASTAALEQEEFDGAFWREVDAAEAAAVLEQQGQSTSSSTSTVAENLSPTMTPPQQRSKQETFHKDGSNVQGMLRYRWKVASISVHGDGSKIEEEWIGEGELEVNCRQVSPSGAIQVENVVVTAEGGGGSAMDIPRHAMTHFSTDGGSLSPLEPIPVTREPPSPPFLLLLGLGIGCSIIMSGLKLLGEHHELPPRVDAGKSCYRSRNVGRGIDSTISTVSDGRDTAVVAAAVGTGLPRKPQLPPTQLSLPIATPERRRLAPTEFATPCSRPLSAPPQDKDNRDRDRDESESETLLRAGVPDPVLARLVYDFGQNASVSSSPLPTASCSENRGIVGNVEFPIARPSALTSGTYVDGMLPTTVDRTPRVASSTDSNQRHECGDSTVALDRGQVLSSGRKGEDAEEEVTAAAAGLSSGGETRAAVTNASVGSTKAAERWHDYSDDAARDGGPGDFGDGVERKKVRKVAGPKKEEGAAVPDGEWRRPLVASPSNRRRAAAGRRMPKARDGARNRNGGVVVLCLHDDDDNDREASTSGAAIKPAASSRGSSVRRAGAAVHDIGVGVGVGVSAGVGEDQQQPEVGEHPRKRLLPVESLAHPSNESLSRKRNRAPPPPQPRSLHTAAGAFRGSRSKGESSWLALRRALHERYRDSEEHGAAEQAAAEAAEHGRGGRAGSSKGGRGGCGGEVMSPGIRVFRRQDHAFTYVDALAARIAAEDAARYRVLSFETSATGSRKFVVCDIRRFEERYPYTALPDPSLLRHLHLPDPTHHRQPGSPSSPPPPPQSTPPHVPSGPAIAEDSSNRGECDSNPGDGRNTGDDVRSPATKTTTSPMSLELLELPQPAAFPAPSPDGAGVSSVGPVCEKPGHPPCPCTSSPPPRPSPLRHMYEIIREGCPCRMYFDLEFARGPNPGLDGEELVCAWINVVAGKLHQEFGVSVGASNVLDLDSSTPKKFSRHLIFHLPGDQLFLDNSHVGRFVNSLAAELESWRAPRSPSTPATPPGIGRDDIVPTADATFAAAAAVAVPHCGSRSGGGNTGGGDHLGGTPASDDFVPTSAVPIPTVATTPREGHGDASTGLAPTTATAPTTAKADCSNGDKTNGGGGGGGGAGALERLWVKDGDGRRVLFADVSVYTRNRCFRLLGSSKFGKAACLRVAAKNQRTLDHMVWRGRGGGTFARTSSLSSSSSSSLSPREQKKQLLDVARTLLHDSLVVPITPRSSPAERFLTVGGGAGQHRYSRFGSCRNQTGDCSSSQQRQQSGWSTNGTMSAEIDGHRGSSQDHGCGSSDGDGWRVSSQGFGPSPFPAVDSFLRTLVCQGGTRGELRQWSYTAGQVPPRTVEHDHQEGNGNGSGNAGGTGLASPGSPTPPRPPATVVRKLTHQVANNRWCWNIGRAHKSNHVFLVTDFSRGEVRQHCHDQECRRSGYRSNPVRLPIGVAPLEDDLEAFELELGLAAAMRESPADWTAVA